MEAHRREAYLDLIYTLLGAPESEAEEILAAKPELTDAGLLETMREVAENLTSSGALEKANRLGTCGLIMYQRQINSISTARRGFKTPA